jgi:hypothetical protein
MNQNLFTSISKNGDVIRIGVSNHFFERNDERYVGMDIVSFQQLLDTAINYNPQIDEMPEGLTNKCYKNITDKQLKYGKGQSFKLIESEDMVVVLNYNPHNPELGMKSQKWNEWVIVSVWKCNGGITLPKEREWIKVGGRYIYL